jgi:acetylornithine deacetylase
VIQIDEAYLVRALESLIKINSVNPGCDVNGPGEGEIARWITRELETLGWRARLVEFAPGRYNAIAERPGYGAGRSLMWNAHTDTVGGGAMVAPFHPRQVGGKLFGRGAIDMKASLAAMIAAAQAIAEQDVRLAGDLVVAAVADEEWGSAGTEALLREVKTDAAIVTEPTDLQICRAHRGYIHFRVETIGRAAHGSRYAEGIDANLHMGRVLWHLDYLEKELRAREPVPLVGVPSLHAAILRGGSEMSIYAARCELNIERRTTPGEDPRVVRQELTRILGPFSRRRS